MKPLKRTLRRFDAVQRRVSWLAFPFAVIKKFTDDQAGRLAALIAYYGFFSMFPLLLLFVSVLGLLLPGHPALRDEIVHSALAQFPVIGTEIGHEAGVQQLTGTWLSAAVGAVGALWAGLGVAQAAQHAMNVVWDIPRADWPSFVVRRLRAALMLVILGTILVISTVASGIGSSGVLPSGLLSVASFAGSLVMNLVLFTLAFQVLTASEVRWRHALPGAVAAAVAWTVLQALGGYYLSRQVRTASDVYGTFGLVIGLLVWIALGAQITLFGAEINVVWFRHLWPRSMVQPPLNEGDRRVYRAIIERARMRPEVEVTVSFTARRGQEDAHAPGASRTPPKPGSLQSLHGHPLHGHREREPVNHPTVALCCSAGGLDALVRVLARLPADLPAAVLILQHLPPDTPSKLPVLLSRVTDLTVKWAEDGDALRPGYALVAPAGQHTLITKDETVALIPSGSVPPYRPSADLLLATLALAAGHRVIATVLSGEGTDAATGATAVHRFGGIVIVSSPETSTRRSMPAATMIRDGITDHVVPLDEVAGLLRALTATPPIERGNGGRPSPPA